LGIGDAGYKPANNTVHVNAINEGNNGQPLPVGQRCIGNSINFSANRASERTHRATVDGEAGVVIAVRRGDRRPATDQRPSLSGTDGGRTCRIVGAGLRVAAAEIGPCRLVLPDLPSRDGKDRPRSAGK